MDDKMFIWWGLTIKRAMDGDRFSIADLRIQNQGREKDGLPTLEEEVLACMSEDVRNKLIAQIQSAYKHKVEDFTQEQLEGFLNIAETGATFGYKILNSVNSEKEWKDQIRPFLAKPLKDLVGYFDFEIEAFLEDLLNYPVMDDNMGKTIKELAIGKGVNFTNC